MYFFILFFNTLKVSLIHMQNTRGFSRILMAMKFCGNFESEIPLVIFVWEDTNEISLVNHLQSICVLYV